MRKLWDMFRWRFVAAFNIAWWFSKGAPTNDFPGHSRWQITKMAWHFWRGIIMYRHERHKYVTVEEAIEHLRSGRET